MGKITEKSVTHMIDQALDYIGYTLVAFNILLTTANDELVVKWAITVSGITERITGSYVHSDLKKDRASFLTAFLLAMYLKMRKEMPDVPTDSAS